MLYIASYVVDYGGYIHTTIGVYDSLDKAVEATELKREEEPYCGPFCVHEVELNKAYLKEEYKIVYKSEDY